MSTILVNTLTGTSTAGSIAVTGEGNSTTTNLQQGLAKSWVNFDGTGTIASRDSLNLSSLTDISTGNYTINVSNSFAAADYGISGISGTGASSGAYHYSTLFNSAPTTSAFSVRNVDNSATQVDSAYICFDSHGDLA